MNWILFLLIFVVLCLFGAVVTLWQNLNRLMDSTTELVRAVKELERCEQAKRADGPQLGYMEAIAENVRRAGPMAGPWTNPVAERYPDVQP